MAASNSVISWTRFIFALLLQCLNSAWSALSPFLTVLFSCADQSRPCRAGRVISSYFHDISSGNVQRREHKIQLWCYNQHGHNAMFNDMDDLWACTVVQIKDDLLFWIFYHEAVWKSATLRVILCALVIL